MRTIPIAAAALAMMTAAAVAQTTAPSTPAPRPAPGATAAPAHREPAINPLTQEDISKIDGTAVYGGDDGKIGHVSDVLMNPDTKKVDRLVVTAGGVMGIGGHRVAIAVDKFSWDADKGAFKLPMTQASLKEMPEWVEGSQPSGVGSSTPGGNEVRIPPASAGDMDNTKNNNAR